jgi:hypothetical protein
VVAFAGPTDLSLSAVGSQAWVDRFRLQREYREHRLVHAPQWLLLDESGQ